MWEFHAGVRWFPDSRLEPFLSSRSFRRLSGNDEETWRIRARAQSLALLLPTLLGRGPARSAPCPGPSAPTEGAELGEAASLPGQGAGRAQALVRGGASCGAQGVRCCGAPQVRLLRLLSPSALALGRAALLVVRSGLLIPGDEHGSWRGSRDERWGSWRLHRGAHAVS